MGRRISLRGRKSGLTGGGAARDRRGGRPHGGAGAPRPHGGAGARPAPGDEPGALAQSKWIRVGLSKAQREPCDFGME